MSERRRLFRDEAFVRRGRTEPIDGLLRITAPHEWLFLALLGCALIGVLAWAVFGTVERGISTACVLTSTTDSELDVVARLSVEDARLVAEGMPARINAFGIGGSLDGLVAQVGLPTGATPDASSQDGDERKPLVLVRLLETDLGTLRDGDICDLRIITSREAPISLIALISGAALAGLE